MSRWFRLYDDMLDDPKVQLLTPELFKTWVNLLAVASRNKGTLPSVAALAFSLRLSAQDMQGRLEELILAGLIDIRADRALEPHNWATRQWKSDDSTERVRKHRALKKNQLDGSVVSRSATSPQRCGDGDVTVTVTPPESYTESEHKLSSSSSRAGQKMNELGLKNGLMKGKGEGAGKGAGVDQLSKRAEGLGIDVERLAAAVDEAKPGNRSAYFTRLCVNELQSKLPGLPEQLIRDALWKKSPQAYTAITGALLMQEDCLQ